MEKTSYAERLKCNREYGRKYYHEHREQYKEKRQEYYRKNRAVILAKARAYYWENHEKLKEYKRIYFQQYMKNLEGNEAEDKARLAILLPIVRMEKMQQLGML